MNVPFAVNAVTRAVAAAVGLAPLVLSRVIVTPFTVILSPLATVPPIVIFYTPASV